MLLALITSIIQQERRSELNKLVNENGYVSVMRDLGLRMTLNKKNITAYTVMGSDMNYLRDKYR